MSRELKKHWPTVGLRKHMSQSFGFVKPNLQRIKKILSVHMFFVSWCWNSGSVSHTVSCWCVLSHCCVCSDFKWLPDIWTNCRQTGDVRKKDYWLVVRTSVWSSSAHWGVEGFVFFCLIRVWTESEFTCLSCVCIVFESEVEFECSLSLTWV